MDAELMYCFIAFIIAVGVPILVANICMQDHLKQIQRMNDRARKASYAKERNNNRGKLKK